MFYGAAERHPILLCPIHAWSPAPKKLDSSDFKKKAARDREPQRAHRCSAKHCPAERTEDCVRRRAHEVASEPIKPEKLGAQPMPPGWTRGRPQRRHLQGSSQARPKSARTCRTCWLARRTLDERDRRGYFQRTRTASHSLVTGFTTRSTSRSRTRGRLALHSDWR